MELVVREVERSKLPRCVAWTSDTCTDVVKLIKFHSPKLPIFKFEKSIRHFWIKIFS